MFSRCFCYAAKSKIDKSNICILKLHSSFPWILVTRSNNWIVRSRCKLNSLQITQMLVFYLVKTSVPSALTQRGSLVITTHDS